MRDKFIDLMKSEGLKSSQLAEILEVNPAGISHIIAGRNKPGYDLLQKILRRFPQINPDWLILDAGPMYRPDLTQTSDKQSEYVSTSPSNSETSAAQRSKKLNGDSGEVGTHRNNDLTDVANSTISLQTAMTEITNCADNRRAIRVIICYDDHTFESFSLNSPTIR